MSKKGTEIPIGKVCIIQLVHIKKKKKIFVDFLTSTEHDALVKSTTKIFQILWSSQKTQTLTNPPLINVPI